MNDKATEVIATLLNENQTLRADLEALQADGKLRYWKERAWKWQHMFELLLSTTGHKLDLTAFDSDYKQDADPEATRKAVVAEVEKRQLVEAKRPHMIPNRLVTAREGKDVLSLMAKINASKNGR